MATLAWAGTWGAASAQEPGAPSVSMVLEDCDGGEEAEFHAALSLELRGVEPETRSWASAAAASATLHCAAERTTLQLHAHGNACGAPVRLGEDTRLGVSLPRLAALAVVELLEACRDLLVGAEAPPVTVETEGSTEPDAGTTNLAGGDDRREPPGAAESTAEPNAERADRLGTPALREREVPRWTASASAGALYAGRSRWAQAVGELELRAAPRPAVSLSLGIFVGGGHTDVEGARVRARLVTLHVLVSGHVHTRRASLELGAGYLGALGFFAGDPVGGPPLAGARAVVPWSGPIVRVEAAWRRGAWRIPLRLSLGWTLPSTRLLVVDEVALEWSGPFTIITVGASWGP